MYSLLVGLFLGFSLIKFGNPIILDHLITRSPADISAENPALSFAFNQTEPVQSDWLEKLYIPWSFFQGLWGVLLLGLFAFKNSKWKLTPPRWLWIALLFWFFWQFVSASHTVNDILTKNTLFQFTACLGCLFIGWHGLPQNKSIRYLWLGLVLGLLFVLWRGFTQHYGGLEAMLKVPNLETLSPDLYKRALGGRIFSTLIYPNALAGIILLLLPSTLIALWQLTDRWPNIYRGLLLGFIAYLGVACLVWTGSKAGWLIAVGMLVICLFQIKKIARIRGWLVLAICVIGITGFFIRYSKYFERGATSVTARFDYWRAAWQTAVTHPFSGTGPGTFMIAYKQVKAPESEMARLAHNDYLEQASDAGFPAFFAFIAFIVGSLYYLYRNSAVKSDPLRYAVLLSLTALFAQSLLEFGLYVPAVAWPAFTLLGWLLGTPTAPIPSPSITNESKTEAAHPLPKRSQSPPRLSHRH